jgi:hypothetical protein
LADEMRRFLARFVVWSERVAANWATVTALLSPSLACGPGHHYYAGIPHGLGPAVRTGPLARCRLGNGFLLGLRDVMDSVPSHVLQPV